MSTARKEEPVIVVCSKYQNNSGDYVRKMVASRTPAALVSEEDCKADPSVLSDHCHVIYLASAAEGVDVFQQIRRMCCG